MKKITKIPKWLDLNICLNDMNSYWHQYLKRSLIFCIVLSLQLSNNTVDQCTLSMSVYSVDRLRKHRLLGHVLLPLRQSELQQVAGKVLWRDLETETHLVYNNHSSDLSDVFSITIWYDLINYCVNQQPLSKNGNIQVSLNYSQALQRLTVVILRARGLQCPSNAGEI